MTDRPPSTIRAVLFDFGGVLTTSPFDAFARYEEANGLPAGFIRSVNATNPDSNPLARLERRELTLDEFAHEFRLASAALGHEIDGAIMLDLIRGDVRPKMINAVRACAEIARVALLTNNFTPMADARQVDPSIAGVLDLFDVIVESAVEGVRKPDPRFYEIALQRLGVEAGASCFLDDLGVNLKPARAMGMTTIKVVSEAQALADLSAATGLDLI